MRHIKLHFDYKSLDLERCPHCGIARPALHYHYKYREPGGGDLPAWDDSVKGRIWGLFQCRACGQMVLARTDFDYPSALSGYETIFPSQRAVPKNLPSIAANYLKQAFDTLGSPDAATVMAASAIDAMLKDKGFKSGSLNARIDAARDKGEVTADMASWAHHVRLEANDVRHADEAKPHATKAEAVQAVEFAEALGRYMYELPAKVTRGIEKSVGKPKQ